MENLGDLRADSKVISNVDMHTLVYMCVEKDVKNK